MEIEVSRVIHGKKFTFNTGKMAKQANGAVFASIEKTQVLGTAVMDLGETEQDFFPLSVHYIEKFYAAGKIPGSYFKREAKPTDSEVLVSRLIDRPLRPLFPEGFRSEVQILLTVLSIDQINHPDVVGMNAASAALVVSDIPFSGPVGAVRIGRVKGEWIINPTNEEMKTTTINLVVAGTRKAITMIEGEAHEYSEEDMLHAVELAHAAIKEIIELQEELAKKVNKAKREVPLFHFDTGLKEKVFSTYTKKLREALRNKDKQARETNVKAVKQAAEAELKAATAEELQSQIGALLGLLEERIVREDIVHDSLRTDGRALDELRPISCEVDVLANAHGSAMFTRGQTQVLAIATLGSSRDTLRIDEISGEKLKPFFLHYNFPPFSVGETGRIGATGRREVGHGMLAERSLEAMMPAADAFPFATRVVAEVLESNGSSSMASVCAGSMSLMAAGIPVKKAVAGIAMGLVMEGDAYKVLTDIQGLEDSLGDMDFKVAGTTEGITGFQLDIKVEGITTTIMREALAQAKKARLFILGKMKEAIPETRKTMSPNVPQMREVQIPIDKIRNVIGPGGKNIKSIVEQTGSDVDINDNGTVKIFASSKESMDKTIRLLEGFTGVPKIGAIYDGVIRRLMPFGAFVEIMPGTDGLVHISEFSDKRVANIQDVAKEGEPLKVKVVKIDDQGRINLSHKQALVEAG